MGGRSRKVTDADIRDIRHMGVAGVAKRTGANYRTVQRAADGYEARTGERIVSPLGAAGHILQRASETHRIPWEIRDGIVVVASDAHYWPGKPPFMHKALLHFLNDFRQRKLLRGFIANGDMLDFAAISRFPLINWEKQPEPQEELEACIDRMHELAVASGRVPKAWPGGNHDLRFNRYIAENAKALRGVAGTHLKDHFPVWPPCWSVMINESVHVKHIGLSQGENAIRINVNKAGIHIVTSHKHAANVVQITKMTGDLYGCDTGCIAEISGPQFLYVQDNVRDWREAFAVLQFSNGRLLPPQLVTRWLHAPNAVVYCNEVIRI